MNLNTLNTLRFITPAILILICFSVLGAMTGEWALALPSDLSDWFNFWPALVLGLLYYLTPFRSLSNQKYFSDVTENIRTRLLEIAGREHDETNEWPKIRKVFFALVDDDDQLKLQANRVMFNGYYGRHWPTFGS
ncbi:MAG: hypothetical protein RIA63_13250 [Cyclobacteriaceae bacterium]